eukprot:TRINITY_DN2485_c0_g1_i12.p1 TRINITY_DN2485_c0_g1~~TRINITY_DN2485_c0_g1_i12.p1  ORF type:complete len:167 (+),score=20.36 TRINITY_DN2485_c0_g1_i12:448-948(+)
MRERERERERERGMRDIALTLQGTPLAALDLLHLDIYRIRQARDFAVARVDFSKELDILTVSLSTIQLDSTHNTLIIKVGINILIYHAREREMHCDSVIILRPCSLSLNFRGHHYSSAANDGFVAVTTGAAGFNLEKVVKIGSAWITTSVAERERERERESVCVCE